MQWGQSRGAGRATARLGWLVVAGCALALGGCSAAGQPMASAAATRGASIAFESIDGPPPEIFRKLVENLNDEAQARRLAVVSRNSTSAYRVRGYIAVHTERTKRSKHAKPTGPGKASVTWVWDVYDAEQNRALRISGEEAVAAKRVSAWTAADDAVLGRIARSSVDQLAAFLTSPAVAPGSAPADGGFTPDSAPAAEPALALAATPD